MISVNGSRSKLLYVVGPGPALLGLHEDSVRSSALRGAGFLQAPKGAVPRVRTWAAEVWPNDATVPPSLWATLASLDGGRGGFVFLGLPELELDMDQQGLLAGIIRRAALACAPDPMIRGVVVITHSPFILEGAQPEEVLYRRATHGSGRSLTRHPEFQRLRRILTTSELYTTIPLDYEDWEAAK